jgi:hypothetical protein
MYSLLVKSGYLDFPEGISEEDLLQGLHAHPEYIRDWRIYSEDKRTTGWYLMEPTAGGFGVGFIPSTRGDGIEPLIYPDETRACAAFIKLEIEYLKHAVKQSELGPKHPSDK